MEVDYAVLTLKIKGEQKEYKIIYDNPLFSKEVFDAFEKWATVADDFTDENLVAYIKMKFPDLKCFTERKFTELLEQFNLNATPLRPDESKN
ncbi:MAG TPA: hypothetical protein VK543_16070 [Puia sp.]|nr:hypothetical protein [Puia sp.]